MSKYDIISIGDCTIDAFLEVEEATVNADIHHEHLKICFSFADKVPYKSLTMLSAGNSNNVAVGMSRLGFKAAYYGTVGKDLNGQTILNKLKSEDVDIRTMSIQKDKPTNFHVVLWYKGERTILIKHEDFKYKLPKEVNDTKWIYYSSVGKHGLVLNEEVAKFLNKKRDVKLSFNPGTFQLRMGMKKLLPILKRTEILSLNKEEAAALLGMKDLSNIRKMAQSLHAKGPKIVVITDGLKGSYCLANNKLYNIGVYPHTPYEATGAGDAFSTAFTAAIMHGLEPSEALRWGARNGASVATKVGPQAGLVRKNQMVSDLKKHKNFKARLV